MTFVKKIYILFVICYLTFICWIHPEILSWFLVDLWVYISKIHWFLIGPYVLVLIVVNFKLYFFFEQRLYNILNYITTQNFSKNFLISIQEKVKSFRWVSVFLKEKYLEDIEDLKLIQMTGVNRFELATNYFHYLAYSLILSIFIRVVFFQDTCDFSGVALFTYLVGDVFSIKYDIKKLKNFIYVQKRSMFSTSGIKGLLKVATTTGSPILAGYTFGCVCTNYNAAENISYVLTEGGSIRMVSDQFLRPWDEYHDQKNAIILKENILAHIGIDNGDRPKEDKILKIKFYIPNALGAPGHKEISMDYACKLAIKTARADGNQVCTNLDEFEKIGKGSYRFEKGSVYTQKK